MRVRFYQVRPQLNGSILFSFCPLADSSSSSNNNATSRSWPSRAVPSTHSAYAVKKGEKVATSQFPTHRGHGFFSATRDLSKLSCDTARRRGAPALSSLVAHSLLGSSVVVAFFSPNFFQCSFSFFSWKQEGKLRKKTKQQVKLRLSPWTVARLRAWANCTNYSDTPAATSIRWNVKLLYNYGITYIHLFFFLLLTPENDKVSGCVFCDPCWHRMLLHSKIGRLRSYRA